MEEQNVLPFPYDFKEITDEEKAAIQKVYNAPTATKLVRVGPKGYILSKNYLKDAANIYNMPLRPKDVFVTSYQRSGTTWTQELVWLLVNDLDYSAAAAAPLTKRYAFLEVFMYFDEEEKDPYLNVTVKKDDVVANKFIETMKLWATPATRLLASAPSPRFVKTHLPMSLLPPRMLETAKVVYVARDPRDVVVSCYHHAMLFTDTAYNGTFKQFWNLFHYSLFLLTPYFEHVKEAWEKRCDPNMLFLFYEELSKKLQVQRAHCEVTLHKICHLTMNFLTLGTKDRWDPGDVYILLQREASRGQKILYNSAKIHQNPFSSFCVKE